MGAHPQDSGEVRRSADTPGVKYDTPARAVVSQLIQAAKTALDGMVEVRLSPEELGRVKLSMTPSETGMTVQVIAERAETMELIRRNINLLAADLRQQGFINLNFSFGGGGASESNSQERDEEPSGNWNTSEDFGAPLQVAIGDAADDGRLDIRL